MPRYGRLKSPYDDQAYHVMTRTIRRVFLFDDDVSKEWIYREILHLAAVYCVELYAVTVMSNHYHIVLSVRKPELCEDEVRQRFELYQSDLLSPRKWRSFYYGDWSKRLVDLSRFMQDLNRNIAIHFNRRDAVSGHFWGDRFKSVLIDRDEGLLRCMAYVEMNCVRAGLCQKPSQYRFCSVGRFHQGGARAAGVAIPPLKAFQFCDSAAERQRAFRFYVDHVAEREAGIACAIPSEISQLKQAIEDEELTELLFRRTQWVVRSLVLGSEQFCRDMMKQFRLHPFALTRTPFRIGGSLCNTHQRAGPHATQ